MKLKMYQKHFDISCLLLLPVRPPMTPAFETDAERVLTTPPGSTAILYQSLPMVCPPHTAHPTFPMESKHRGGIAVADSGAAHARGGRRWPPRAGLSRRERNVSLFSFFFLSLFGSITGRDNKALFLSGTTSLSSRRIRRRRRRRRWSPQRARAPHIVVRGEKKSLFLFFSSSCPASFGLQSTNPATCYLIGNPPSKERERLLTTITTRTTTTCIHCVTSFLL
jgi:hypothetical protein